MRDSRYLSPSVLLSLPVFYLCWIIFVGNFTFQELLVGLVASLLAATGLLTIDVSYPARFSPALTELLSLWRLPWYLLSGTSEIVAVAAKDLIGFSRAKSLFRVVPFNAGQQDDAHDTARRVLAVAYTTIAPNFIVLGINPSDQKLLFHQIERSSVPRTTVNLGAHA